jgi:hypothetical protein
MQALMLDQLQVVVGGLVGIRAPLRRAPRLMMHYGDLASSERLTIERGHLPTIAPVARPFLHSTGAFQTLSRSLYNMD